MMKVSEAMPDEMQRKCINDVIARIGEIDDPASVGVIAAQDIVDIVVENLGPAIYNTGVRDAKKLIQNHHTDIDYELDELEQAS